MGSRLAITERRPAKGKGLGGVLFQFFDWNKMLSKKKKKLFLNNKLLLPSVSKKFGGDERMPMSKPMHFLIPDENLGGSKFPQKQNGLDNKMRDPGPVAKLMGLESVPIVRNKKPIRSSLASEFGSNRYKTFEVKESRPQKLQRTGGFVERQQQPVASSLEALQSNRRARRLHHHKLSSPVKSPRLLAKRSTSRLMGATTKMLEPGLQSQRNHARCALTYTGSSQSDVKVYKEGVFMKKCNVSTNDSVMGTSRSFRSLSETTELGSLVKEYSHVENKMNPLESRTPSPFSVAKVDAKRSLGIPIGKDRPTSTDVQPKINAESRPCGLYQNRNCIQDEHNRKNLTQNQLPPIRGKLAYGSKMCNTQSNRRDLIASDSSLSSRTHSRSLIKEFGRERVEIERNGLERKNKDPKRRPNDDLQSESGQVVSFTFEKRQSARSALINRKEKGVVNNHSTNHSSVKCEFMNHVEGNGASGFEGNGIVSFTFSSPMKHVSRSLSNGNMADKRRCIGKPKSNPCPKILVSAEKIHSMESQREETLRGDSLSALLEQKIEELNSLDADEFATEDSLEGRSTASILGELISALRPSQEHTSCSGSTNISGHTISHGEMFKAKERFQTLLNLRNFSGNMGPNHEKAVPEAGVSFAYLVDGDHPSPMSILDASFSNDSCFSVSPNGSSGHKPDYGSIDTCTNVQSIDLDTDLLDSASSVDIEKFDTEKIPKPLGENSVFKDTVDLYDVWLSESKLSYSTEAKHNAKLLIDNVSLPKSNGKDSFIRDTLEAITKALGVTDTGIKLRRFLFDCMIECMDAQYNCFFKSGSKLSSLTRSNWLAKVVREEIEGWNGLVGKGMDDIVEKDTRHSNGTWTLFEMEAFETCVQIENDIVNRLVGEIVVDLCT